MRKSLSSFGSRLASSSLRLSIGQGGLLRTLSLPRQKGKWHTTARVCVAFPARILSCYCDAEGRETLRYVIERVAAPIGAQSRHDLRLELHYLYKMYGPDTPLVFTRALPPETHNGNERQAPNTARRRLYHCMCAYFTEMCRRRREVNSRPGAAASVTLWNQQQGNYQGTANTPDSSDHD